MKSRATQMPLAGLPPKSQRPRIANRKAQEVLGRIDRLIAANEKAGKHPEVIHLSKEQLELVAGTTSVTRTETAIIYHGYRLERFDAK